MKRLLLVPALFAALTLPVFTVPASAQVQEISFAGTASLRPALAKLDPARE